MEARCKCGTLIEDPDNLTRKCLVCSLSAQSAAHASAARHYRKGVRQMSLRRSQLEADIEYCISAILDDESWQGSFTDDERRIWLNAASAFIRHTAYCGRSPRAQLPRVLRMLRAGADSNSDQILTNSDQILTNSETQS